LRGIAGFRGAMLPVYDLHVLLGHPPAQTPRWLVIAAAAPVALAFEAFAGQLRIAQDDILPQAPHSGMHGYARDVVRTRDFVGPILHLPSVLGAIKMSKADPASAKE
jgi:purine-binding chemotaxis protein CheW